MPLDGIESGRGSMLALDASGRDSSGRDHMRARRAFCRKFAAAVAHALGGIDSRRVAVVHMCADEHYDPEHSEVNTQVPHPVPRYGSSPCGERRR